MERAIQIFAIINFVVIGISHAVRPKIWADYFAILQKQGEAGVFAAAFLSLSFGSLIVAFHNVWTGIPLVLTLLGWAQVLKALIYFAFPAFALRKMRIPTRERANLFVGPGLVFLGMAALLGYHLWRS